MPCPYRTLAPCGECCFPFWCDIAAQGLFIKKEELLWQTSEEWVKLLLTATIIRSRNGSKSCVTNKSRASANREMTLNVSSWHAGWVSRTRRAREHCGGGLLCLFPLRNGP